MSGDGDDQKLGPGTPAPTEWPTLRSDELAGHPPEDRDAFRAVGAVLRGIADTSPEPRKTDAWQERLFRDLDAKGVDATRRRRARYTRIAALAAIPMIVVIIVLAARRPGPPPREPALAVHVNRQGEARLGEDASPGDVLVIEASAADDAVVRVYDGTGKMVGGCGRDSTETPSCMVSRSESHTLYNLRQVLAARGTYRVIMFVGSPSPTPTGTMNGDLAAARGIRVVTAPPVVVR